jgi:hypothetical protein
MGSTKPGRASSATTTLEKRSRFTAPERIWSAVTETSCPGFIAPARSSKNFMFVATYGRCPGSSHAFSAEKRMSRSAAPPLAASWSARDPVMQTR